MNERIREFIQEATGYTMSVYELNGVRTFGERVEFFDKEKFAELIVRECMRMCDVADMSLLVHNCVKEASGTQSAKDFIKEHFGVE